MFPNATVSVDRLTVRIAQLETSNIALSGIVATVIAAAIFVMAVATAPHLGRSNAAQHGISSCSTSKATSAACPARKLPFRERIISA